MARTAVGVSNEEATYLRVMERQPTPAQMQLWLATIAQMTYRKAQGAGAGPELLALLEEPLSAARLAHAYLIAWNVLGSDSENGRLALRIIRDLLLLVVCTGHGPWDHHSLVNVLNAALPESDDLTISQLLQAFSSIRRLGGSRAAFDMACPEIYGGVGEPMATDLFRLFHNILVSSPQFISHGQTRPRRGPRVPRIARERDTRADNDLALQAAAGEPLGEPMYIPVPSRSTAMVNANIDYMGNTNIDETAGQRSSSSDDVVVVG